MDEGSFVIGFLHCLESKYTSKYEILIEAHFQLFLCNP